MEVRVADRKVEDEECVLLETVMASAEGKDTPRVVGKLVHSDTAVLRDTGSASTKLTTVSWEFPWGVPRSSHLLLRTT